MPYPAFGAGCFGSGTEFGLDLAPCLGACRAWLGHWLPRLRCLFLWDLEILDHQIDPTHQTGGLAVEQDLPAVPGGHDPGCPVEYGTEGIRTSEFGRIQLVVATP
jgi:hypothetical protein